MSAPPAPTAVGAPHPSGSAAAYASLFPDVGTLDRNTRLRFLLLEDSEGDSALVLALLEEELPRVEVEVATSLQEALERLDTEAFDLILADLGLPDADGATVVRRLRDAHPHVTLMILTGRVDGTLALWALAAGAQDYLVKGQHDGPRLADALLHGLQRSRTDEVRHALLVAALNQETLGSERLRELNLAKSDFVATVSHELRTPLTSITAYAELLQDEAGLDARQIGFVDSIARNAARLTALTTDLLVLSGYATRDTRMAHVEVDLRMVVEQVHEVVVTLATKQRVRVELDLPDQPVLVIGDAQHLERVVLNLMSNATKFSTDGGTVVCCLRTTPTKSVIEVSDTGIGIPADEQRELFTRFFRGSTARDLAIQGTGLGLHIVASIVANHGGEVTVESGRGRGTIFTVTLPRAVSGAAVVD